MKYNFFSAITFYIGYIVASTLIDLVLGDFKGWIFEIIFGTILAFIYGFIVDLIWGKK